MISYLICSQPRTGTHLLRGLLTQYLCGNPLELFYQLTYEDRIPTIDVFYDEYYKKNILNDILGVTIHGIHYKRAMERIREFTGMVAENDYEVMKTLFDDPKYIYIYRENRVKEAVSWAKAEKTGHFLSKGDVPEVSYDKHFIYTHLAKICVSERYWMEFFDEHGITPYILSYEELCADYEGCLKGIFEFLGVPYPEIKIDTSKLPVRQYDEINEAWYRKFMGIL